MMSCIAKIARVAVGTAVIPARWIIVTIFRRIHHLEVEEEPDAQAAAARERRHHTSRVL